MLTLFRFYYLYMAVLEVLYIATLAWLNRSRKETHDAVNVTLVLIRQFVLVVDTKHPDTEENKKEYRSGNTEAAILVP